MRILSINNSADIYGASKCLLRLLRPFVRAGHQVHVVLPADGPLRALLQAEGIKVHLCPNLAVLDRSSFSSVQGIFRFLLHLPLSSLWLARLIRQQKIDLVHTNTAVLPSPAIAARLSGRAHVWHIREFFSEFRGVWKFYQRYMNSLSAKVIAISDCVKEQFDPPFRNNVVVIYDGLDAQEEHGVRERASIFRSKFAEADVLVGVIGRIKWLRKGQEILVRAAALLQEKYPRVHYVVVGSSTPENADHTQRLIELIEELHLTDSITLVGEIADISAVQAALDISVVPSVQAEPFGMVVIESMALRTAVIGSRCGGIAEQIVDGTSGILFPPGDARALADALELLIKHPATRERMANEGYQRVQSEFLIDKTFAETHALFAVTLSSKEPLIKP